MEILPPSSCRRHYPLLPSFHAESISPFRPPSLPPKWACHIGLCLLHSSSYRVVAIFSILAIFGLMFIMSIHSNNRMWIGSAMLATSLIACCARVPGISMVTQHRSQVKMADKNYNAMWEYSTWGGDDSCYGLQPLG